MARLYRLWILRRARAARACNFSAIFLVLSALWAFNISVHAAPVTFRFDATVTEVNRSPAGTFDLPFAVNPGDSMEGTVQFEPILFGESGQVTKMEFNFPLASFSAEEVPLVTFDNYVVPISGSSVGGIFDGINVGCSTPSSCAGATSSLSGIAVDQIRLGLASGTSKTLILERVSSTAHSGIDLSSFLQVGS